MHYPKISIVTPNFNGEEYLEQTIQSVLSQNYPNLEYIIIDGGSTDNSIDIIRKYDKQLAYWISEPDNGLYHAVQKGFDQSTGEIMAWINSDDLYHSKSFFTVAEIFSRFNEVNWLQGTPSFFDELGRIVSVGAIKRWSKLDYYLGNFKWIQQESVFWRRSLWIKSGSKIDISMKYAGDLELWMRFFRHEKLFSVSALLAGFRQRGQNQLSLDYLDQYIEEAKLKIKYELEKYVSNEDKKLVKRIKNYTSIISKAPVFKNVFFKILNLWILKKKQLDFNYMKIITFDRIRQEFKITV